MRSKDAQCKPGGMTLKGVVILIILDVITANKQATVVKRPGVVIVVILDVITTSKQT